MTVFMQAPMARFDLWFRLETTDGQEVFTEDVERLIEYLNIVKSACRERPIDDKEDNS